MSNFSRVMTNIKNKLSEKSPYILTGVGIASGVTAAVFAAVSTQKLAPILDEASSHLDALKETYEKGHIDKKAYQKSITREYLDIFMKITKVYLPTVGFMAFGIACHIASTKILDKRNRIAVAAFENAVDAFEAYKAAVREKMGDTSGAAFVAGSGAAIVTEKIVRMNDNGSQMVNEKGKPIVDEVEALKVDDSLARSAAAIEGLILSPSTAPNLNWEMGTRAVQEQIAEVQHYANIELQREGAMSYMTIKRKLQMHKTSVRASDHFAGWIYDKEMVGPQVVINYRPFKPVEPEFDNAGNEVRYCFLLEFNGNSNNISKAYAD